MAPQKKKSAKKLDAPAPILDAVEGPKEGTKGVIWGQQVKKSGWVDDLEWTDAAPANFDEFLMGAEEGGFMALEEIDGDVFDKSTKGLAKAKDGKKRPLESDEVQKIEKPPKKQKAAKSDAPPIAPEEGLNDKAGKRKATKEKATEKGDRALANGGAKAAGKTETKDSVTKNGETKAAGGKEKIEKAAPKPKAKKMTSSEIKKRKKEKRRERMLEEKAAKEKPVDLAGLFQPRINIENADSEHNNVKIAEQDDKLGGENEVAASVNGKSGGKSGKAQNAKERKLEKREQAKRKKMEATDIVNDHDISEAAKSVDKMSTKVFASSDEARNGQKVPPSIENEGSLTGAERMAKKQKVLERTDKGPVEEEVDAEKEERRASGQDTGPSECDVSAWEAFGLHPLLLKALAKMGFSQPTEIQKQCIPAALQQGKDLVGAAETGSGKTLAFGLPILHRLLQIEEKEQRPKRNGESSEAKEKKKGGSPMRALIMVPTRELALQVCTHLKAAAQETSIRVVAIVGGMAVVKQQRQLKARPAIVVGTPGRLWELMSQGEQHLLQVDDLRFFVLDEADRMVEKGHFAELQSIIDSLPKRGGAAPADSSPLEEKAGDVAAEEPKHVAQRQTFVFSATLMVPPSLKTKLKGAGKTPMRREQGQVAALIERAGLSRRAAIVDLTSASMVASKLEEAVLECLDTEKDAYLYYLLRLHPSRTIVFCTAISAVRRIAALFKLLQVPSWALHAQMQQRQRLKAMDRFKRENHGVLIATDVAARGLDIEGIRCVIHYQLPLSAEIYVHRSGRTARASADGLSVALISPSERPKLNALCKALGKAESLPTFPVDQAYMPAVLERVKLAIKVDSGLRQQQQTKAKRSWLQKNADELGVELDDDELEEQSRTSKKGKVRVENDNPSAPAHAKAAEAKLRALIKQPLQPRAMRHTYLAAAGLDANTAKQLQSAIRRKGKAKPGAIGTPQGEALDALRSKRVKQ